MFTMDEVLSKRNQRDAFNFLERKKDSCGSDGMRLADLKEYWLLNHEWIEKELKKGTYQPGIVKCYDITTGHGKRRTVSTLTGIDKFVTRLLSQKLNRYFTPLFLPNSYAYQDGKGVTEAVAQAKRYADSGLLYVAKIDIKNFFDTINLELLLRRVQEKISDESIIQVLDSFLHCDVFYENKVIHKTEGVVQGSSISPVLSNIYMHSLDQYMEDREFNWIRFADDIHIFCSDRQSAMEILNETASRVQETLLLKINEKKSNVCKIYDTRVLGYDFYLQNGNVEAKKHIYQKQNKYNDWQPSILQKVNNEYHIVQDGVLNKKDYAMIFENTQEKHHIPVEAVHQLNVYGNINLTSNVLKTVTEHKIRIGFFDRYGQVMGYYIPENCVQSSVTVMKQYNNYQDESLRVETARAMEIAGIHNMRSNIKYYSRKNNNVLDEITKELSNTIVCINNAKTVEEMMLYEARARERYYHGFDQIVKEDFQFEKRTRRPPRNEVNAMISFGNTLLYNKFLHYIWKTSLDARVGVVHATNKRLHSLNLDFADIFKPVLVDRVIFTLINCKQIKKEIHFQHEEEGVLLNEAGKKIFLSEFQKKLLTTIIIKGNTYTYQQLMENEVKNYEKFILKEEKYRPYKYY